MKFDAILPISYRPTFGRKLRTGYVLPILCDESERDRANEIAWALRRTIGDSARVGESDDSVDLYVMDTTERDAMDALEALVEAMKVR